MKKNKKNHISVVFIFEIIVPIYFKIDTTIKTTITAAINANICSGQISLIFITIKGDKFIISNLYIYILMSRFIQIMMVGYSR